MTTQAPTHNVTPAPSPPTPPKATTVNINQRISRAGLYIEPLILDLMHRSAKDQDESVNSWIRKACLRRLLEEGRISQEIMIRLIGA